MRLPSTLFRLTVLGLLAAGPLLSACSDEIGAPPPSQAYYTLWGTLNPSAPRQVMRVIPVLPQINAERPEPMDAVVTTTDLATGTVYMWNDSTITFPSGRVGHVFHVDQPIGYERSQLVTVTRSDGATTSAYVRMPPDVVPIRERDINVFVDRAQDLQYPFFWPRAPRLEVVHVRYYYRDNLSCAYSYLTAPGSDGAVTAEPTESGWRTTWSRNRTRARSFGNYPNPRNLVNPYELREVTMVVEVSTADARPPGGVYDPFLYFDPGAFTNVARGFGLIIGAYQ
ncbi:MAG TPA: hypothetical protein VD948_12800, partial [Rhodothermales bacterium]|nr:hypothetical protein [Rhodothermales bacterium]